MQYSNVAGKQKSNDVYRYPAELTSGKVRRLKFETVTDAADTDITIGFCRLARPVFSAFLVCWRLSPPRRPLSFPPISPWVEKT